MKEAEKKECLIPFSLDMIEEVLGKLTDMASKSEEITEDILGEFRNAANIFFKKYGKDCSCDECYKMIEKLINIILNKINIKVLRSYGIELHSIGFIINEHVPTITVIIEDKKDAPVTA
jgi:hypothetical protein